MMEYVNMGYEENEFNVGDMAWYLYARDIWTRRDGTRINLCDMTDKHLDNTILMLERNSSNSQSGMNWLNKFYKEKKKRKSLKTKENKYGN